MNLNIWKRRSSEPELDPEAFNLGRLLTGREIGFPQRFGHIELIPILGNSSPKQAYSPMNTTMAIEADSTAKTIELKNPGKSPMIVPKHIGFEFPIGKYVFVPHAVLLKGGKSEKILNPIFTEAIPNIGPKHPTQLFLPHPVRAFSDVAENDNVFTKTNSPLVDLMYQSNPAARNPLKWYLENGADESPWAIPDKQIGAILVCNKQIIGFELMPDPTTWASIQDVWVRYGINPLRGMKELRGIPFPEEMKLDVEQIRSLNDLKAEFQALLENRKQQAEIRLEPICQQLIEITALLVHEYYQSLHVETADFQGQMIVQGGEIIYASLYHKKRFQLF